MSDIFISYKREDQTKARTLAESLEGAGWSVWWDPQLRAGEHFDEVIERELSNAKCIIVLWSHRSIESQYVKDEATYALNLKKLIPVAIDEVSPPFRFQGLHTLFLSGWSGSQGASVFQKLLVDIESVVGPPMAKIAPTESANSSRTEEAHGGEATRSSSSQAVQPNANEEGRDAISAFGVTATYGLEFKKTSVRDIYSFKVYVNLLARASDADHRAKKEIDIFLKNENYDSYEIISRRRNLFLGYYEYTVQFKGK